MLWTAFILGFAGSIHCAAMCGAIALALPHPGRGWLSFVTGRLTYNLGRIATYALLGVIFGLAGRSLELVGAQRWVSVIAGGIILAGLTRKSSPIAGPVVYIVARLKSALGCQFRHRSMRSLFVLGLLNGLLPCGLVYAAGAGAAATGGVGPAVDYMIIFGLGTVPMMLGVSVTGQALPARWRAIGPRLLPVSLVVVASLLILRGLALGIPYLSPDISTSTCCIAR